MTSSRRLLAAVATGTALALLVSACGDDDGGAVGAAAPPAFAALTSQAGCGAPQSPPEEGFQHVSPPDEVAYGTTPPTSGNHYPTWSSTGAHREPIPNEVQVHNLEHGHVGIHYQGIEQPMIDALEQVAREDDQWVFVAPYPEMTHKVAFTAWQRLLTCDQPNDRIDEVAREFVRLFKDKSRESIPGDPRPA